MNDKIFSSYFIIKDNIVLSTRNFNFDEKLKNCFYVRKLGSNIHPKFYLDIKENNEWIIKNKYIGNYKSFMDFVIENKNSFICVRGFSRAYMGHFINNINLNYGCNLLLIDKKYLKDKYENHLSNKEETLEEIKEKTKEKEISGVDEYKKITNNVLNKKRIKSRNRINSLIHKDK